MALVSATPLNAADNSLTLKKGMAALGAIPFFVAVRAVIRGAHSCHYDFAAGVASAVGYR